MRAFDCLPAPSMQQQNGRALGREGARASEAGESNHRLLHAAGDAKTSG